MQGKPKLTIYIYHNLEEISKLPRTNTRYSEWLYVLWHHIVCGI